MLCEAESDSNFQSEIRKLNISEMKNRIFGLIYYTARYGSWPNE